MPQWFKRAARGRNLSPSPKQRPLFLTDLAASSRTTAGPAVSVTRSLRKRFRVMSSCACILITAFGLLALNRNPIHSSSQNPCLKAPSRQPRIQRIAYSALSTSSLVDDSAEGRMNQTAAAVDSSKYTILLNSFKRHDLLKAAIAHYGMCSQADAIRVVWSEDSRGPPSVTEDATFYGKGHVEVIYDLQPTPSLNNRFAPMPGLRTTAVLSIDDDIRLSPSIMCHRVPCSEVANTFAVWQQFQDRMVGWFPRGVNTNRKTTEAAAWRGQAAVDTASSGPAEAHLLSPAEPTHSSGWHSGHRAMQAGGSIAQCSFEYQSRDSAVLFHGSYDMVLTKGAFLHRDWLTTYATSVPPAVRSYVDAHRNCEDIAMAFMVADATGLSPIYHRAPSLQDLGQGLWKIKGISSLAGHAGARSACIQAFVPEFGGLPLVNYLLSTLDNALQLRLSTLLDRAI